MWQFTWHLNGSKVYSFWGIGCESKFHLVIFKHDNFVFLNIILWSSKQILVRIYSDLNISSVISVKTSLICDKMQLLVSPAVSHLHPSYKRPIINIWFFTCTWHRTRQISLLQLSSLPSFICFIWSVFVSLCSFLCFCSLHFLVISKTLFPAVSYAAQITNRQEQQNSEAFSNYKVG